MTRVARDPVEVERASIMRKTEETLTIFIEVCGDWDRIKRIVGSIECLLPFSLNKNMRIVRHRSPKKADMIERFDKKISILKGLKEEVKASVALYYLSITTPANGIDLFHFDPWSNYFHTEVNREPIKCCSGWGIKCDGYLRERTLSMEEMFADASIYFINAIETRLRVKLLDKEGNPRNVAEVEREIKERLVTAINQWIKRDERRKSDYTDYVVEQCKQ